MTICLWKTVWHAIKRGRIVRMENRAQGASSESMSETSCDQSSEISASSGVLATSRRMSGKLSHAVSKVRDSYVNCMLGAATMGDCSTLVYGNGYCGNDFQFRGNRLLLNVEEQAEMVRCMSMASSRSEPLRSESRGSMA